ncbi:MAG: 3-oxoacyl-ACP reductase FabG [Vicinamibacteria bacterium]
MIDTGLNNKSVVVTGGAGGIGKGTALAFAAEGCKVAVWDVKGDEPGIVGELKAAGAAEAMFIQLSTADAAAVHAATTRVIETFGEVDVLINNAGVLRDGMLAKVKDGQVSVMSDEQFDLVIDVNLRGVFVCTRAVVPHMIAQKSGVIISASSVVGLYGNFGQTNYVATKAGVIGMTKVWARELGKHGIRVNAIAPGFIETEMVRQMPPKALESMVQHTPLARMGKVEDIANAYVFLASDQGSFITGHCLSVDGGAVPGT